MPEISRFFGILIRVYFDDHNPPHFHAMYAGDEARVGIEPIAILEGRASESCRLDGFRVGGAPSSGVDAELESST
jgi:hypothetical protein